jgi:hypothetical protein
MMPVTDEIHKVAEQLNLDTQLAIDICYPPHQKSLCDPNISWSHVFNVLALMGWRKAAADGGSKDY